MTLGFRVQGEMTLRRVCLVWCMFQVLGTDDLYAYLEKYDIQLDRYHSRERERERGGGREGGREGKDPARSAVSVRVLDLGMHISVSGPKAFD